MMKARILGHTGLVVSTVGLGCMGMSEFYGPADEAESMATIHRALSLGVTLFDTADMYGVGKNEEVVGRAIRECRDRVILATKFGNVRGASGEFLGVNGRPEYVKRVCEASLKRLGVKHIEAQEDWRRRHPRFEGENFKRNLHLAETVRQIAEGIGCTPAQLALAWVLAQGQDIVPIPGTKHPRYLEENIGALKVHLTDRQLGHLDEAFPVGVPAGERYPEQGMRTINR
jgi:aryl-alcohol dehydrogenase-like predicted oxidoreductase